MDDYKLRLSIYENEYKKLCVEIKEEEKQSSNNNEKEIINNPIF